MRALVQRVSQAAVDVEGERVAQIGPGMLVLLGVSVEDTEAEADRLADKVSKLRIFDDAEGRMNEPLGEEREVLCVSQFTLYGDTRKGNRPSYVRGRAGRAGGAAVRALLRAPRGQAGSVRRLHGRRPRKRRPGDGDAGGLTARLVALGSREGRGYTRLGTFFAPICVSKGGRAPAFFWAFDGLGRKR